MERMVGLLDFIGIPRRGRIGRVGGKTPRHFGPYEYSTEKDLTQGTGKMAFAGAFSCRFGQKERGETGKFHEVENGR